MKNNLSFKVFRKNHLKKKHQIIFKSKICKKLPKGREFI